jgi:hypothetical protein
VESAESPAAIAEYAALRGEMDSRAKYQQQILALQLTLTSAIFSFGLSRDRLVGILLVIPISSYLLSGRYIAQRTSILRMTVYISDVLSERVSGGFGWDVWSRANPRRGRGADWLVPMLLTFPGASLFALGWAFPLAFYRDGVALGARIGLIAAWAAGLFGAFVTTRMISKIYFRGAP